VAALDLYAESHRLLVASLGERHPTVAVLAYNIATNLLMLERFDEAERALGEAAAIEDPLHGVESLQATSRLALLAEIHLRSGRLESGEGLIRRTIEILGRVAPTDRRRRLNFDSQLGWALLLQRRFTEAVPLLERTLAAQAEVVGDPSVEVAETSGRLAMIELGRGELERARELIDRSAAQYEQTDPDPHQHAEAWFRRAQILVAQGDRGAAIALARRAQAFYAARGDQPSRAAAVDAWLAIPAAPAHE
jgi:tetratricopeptide (TPR) repeat protein